ncbi:RNA polymerase sigma factor [Actinokineospora sp. HUAS TT18]|uniref:RNA polymerase sigma factor n=1 Tax=Actinokineospora sp. HUAS TT18 TaxID=3447451 RepID=UPI003F5231D2
MTDDTDAPDPDLVRRVQRGDRTAVEALYRRHWGAVLGYATTLTRDRAGAEDIASEGFLRVWEAMRSGSTPEKPRGYLFQTVRNLHIGQARRATRRADVDPTDDAQSRTPAAPDHSAAIIERGALAEAVAALTPGQRAMLWRTAVEGYSAAEVAARDGLATANAGAQLAVRARRALGRAYAKVAADGQARSRGASLVVVG